MSIDELAKLVKAMRKLQKDYFRTRNPQILRECRDMERRVDMACECVLDSPDNLLFGPIEEGTR